MGEKITNMAQFRREFFPEDLTRYPMRLDIYVTQAEKVAILDWVNARHIRDYVERDEGENNNGHKRNTNMEI